MARSLLCVLLLAVTAAGGEMFNDKVAVLDPFPREVARGKTLVLKGVLKGAYRAPELILIAPRGKTYLNKERDLAGQTFTFTVHFEEGVGPYRLEMIARTPDATRSAARFTVWYGKAKEEQEPEVPGAREVPQNGWPKTSTALDGPLLEKRFWRQMNEFRKSIGCEPLGWNEAVAARAREHAARMAEAERRQHRFGKDSVEEMLERDGAGPGGLSGPDLPWGPTDEERPFVRPAPGPPGPRIANHVVVQNVSGESLDDLLERYFVHEAAFRICAADPNCLELAVGVARTPSPLPVTGKTSPPVSPLLYICVCFVQVNEKPIIQGQERAFDALLRRGRERHPDVLRALGKWGRGEPKELLTKALSDPKPEVASAALDALLLLDEGAARSDFELRIAPRVDALREGRYADAIALCDAFRHVLYDREIARAYDDTMREAQTAAQRELSALAQKPPEGRAAAAEDLKRRARGLGLDGQIDKAVAKS